VGSDCKNNRLGDAIEVKKGRYSRLIGIGRPLTVSPLPHHRAYGSRTTAVRQS
jgi:hypothetical protein